MGEQIFRPDEEIVRPHGILNIRTMENITIIHVDQIVVNGASNYKNGDFIPVFLEELYWLARRLNPITLKVLIYLLSKIDKHNQVYVDISEIKENLEIGTTKAYEAINELKNMRILCKTDETKMKYKIKLFTINPSLAFHGNTRKINKKLAPKLMDPTGQQPLIPKDFAPGWN